MQTGEQRKGDDIPAPSSLCSNYFSRSLHKQAHPLLQHCHSKVTSMSLSINFLFRRNTCMNLTAMWSLRSIWTLRWKMWLFNHCVIQRHVPLLQKKVLIQNPSVVFPSPCLQPLLSCCQGKRTLTRMSSILFSLWLSPLKLLLTILVCGKNIW